ncbi:hypothetical protein DEU56DRAFT_755685 [Suillus clintonianus]|uniref:uncharacterized protein n=1 Tax=Suillus clintonianus TaxID=1904413 RepID=UPI001B864F68|nr:uncharacterized protein DEU56DRAFT_755685 [Suillus clintonianus]KAG2138967.1 hypothetical protein DEU56DRAFT_755685 [Suillus clintonianus]
MTEGIEVDAGTDHMDDTRFCAADMEEEVREVEDIEVASEETGEEVAAEAMGIWMPSSIPYPDALALGLYSTWAGTRSKQEANYCQIKIDKCVQSYQRTRNAMQRLGADEDTLKNVYQEIQLSQLSVDREVTEENRYEQGSDRLAWFRRVNNGHVYLSLSTISASGIARVAVWCGADTDHGVEPDTLKMRWAKISVDMKLVIPIGDGDQQCEVSPWLVFEKQVRSGLRAIASPGTGHEEFDVLQT